ncbi:hypothetical protein [Pseudonocardia spirodelae]|uniref:Uncharacterized protein n=1 Tax=Pseudonocardia spirodelae TaxID=3133431 RepID=A0ABU8T370_9PSEU
MRTGGPGTRTAVDFAGVRLGTVQPDGQVVDDAGIHIGWTDPAGRVLDFGGIHIGDTAAGADAQRVPVAGGAAT